MNGNEKELEYLLGTFWAKVVFYEIKNYSESIIYDSNCYEDCLGINHSMLLVGYGTEIGTDYWLLENSWDTNWGKDGYVYIARNQNNYSTIGCYAIYCH